MLAFLFLLGVLVRIVGFLLAMPQKQIISTTGFVFPPLETPSIMCPRQAAGHTNELPIKSSAEDPGR